MGVLERHWRLDAKDRARHRYRFITTAGKHHLAALVEVDRDVGVERQPPLRQPGVAQHVEVTRYTWLMHPDLLDQLTDLPLAVPDSVKDPSPCRFSDHFEDRDFCWHGTEHTP